MPLFTTNMSSLQMDALFLLCIAHIVSGIVQNSSYSKFKDKALPQTREKFCTTAKHCTADYLCVPWKNFGILNIGVCRPKSDAFTISRHCNCPKGTTCAEVLKSRSAKSSAKVLLSITFNSSLGLTYCTILYYAILQYISE